MGLQRQSHRDLRGALVAMGELADQPVAFGLQRNQLERGVHMPGDIRGFRAAGPEPPAPCVAMGPFSNTVSSGKISVIWKVLAMPRATRSWVASRVMS